jgi:hypothetical protein
MTSSHAVVDSSAGADDATSAATLKYLKSIG